MNKSIDRESLVWRVHGQHPLFNTDEDLLGTRAGRRIGAAASAFRGIRVFCLVFILCVYPCHHQITIHPTAEDRKRLRFTYRLLWSTDQKKKKNKRKKKCVEIKDLETRKKIKRKKGMKKWKRLKKKKSAHGENILETRFSVFSIDCCGLSFPREAFFLFYMYSFQASRCLNKTRSVFYLRTVTR